jgi:hypothetical protein
MRRGAPAVTTRTIVHPRLTSDYWPRSLWNKSRRTLPRRLRRAEGQNLITDYPNNCSNFSVWRGGAAGLRNVLFFLWLFREFRMEKERHRIGLGSPEYQPLPRPFRTKRELRHRTSELSLHMEKFEQSFAQFAIRFWPFAQRSISSFRNSFTRGSSDRESWAMVRRRIPGFSSFLAMASSLSTAALSPL